MGAQNGEAMDGLVTFQTSQGVQLRATLHRLTRNHAVFETHSPEPLLRMSEVLSDFTLLLYERPVYSGKAVVCNLIQTGPCTVCEARLGDAWVEGSLPLATANPGEVQSGFRHFLEHWGKTYHVLPEFKVVIADIHSFLLDLRSWLEQIELTIRSNPAGSRSALERQFMEALTPNTTAAIAELYDRFDQVARKIEPDFVPVHQAFGRRHLHPLILAAPFVYRTLQKPLGYAGDYEMVNMMMRDPYEGASMFAKAFNVCALSRPPIVAHQNRLLYLADKLLHETLRSLPTGRQLRILNVGCGPAHEIRKFFRDQSCSDNTSFTLVDFDAETLAHVSHALAECKARYGRSAQIQTRKQSVQQMLKQSMRSADGKTTEQFDFIYCAGLFDYLPDPICRSLVSYFYDLLAPGGLTLVTNVDTHPSRNEMEYFLEWHLIYRDTQAMRSLAPPRVHPDNIALVREPSGINIFLELRKPTLE
jgi:extracellular factor (EF) 3-hydroxypalmitic acid methyl ester biosynthesis protein